MTLFNFSSPSSLVPVVTSQEMVGLEQRAFKEGYSDAAFMEEAGKKIARAADLFIQQGHEEPPILLLCGKGNNAGDAYVAGCYLLQKGYFVRALQLAPLDLCSPLCQEQGHRFMSQGGSIHLIRCKDDLHFVTPSVVIDGLLGTGFHGQVEGLLEEVIRFFNESRYPILSIDIPSGLNGNTGEAQPIAIQATVTLYLGFPKVGFFLKEGRNFTGKLLQVDFGLPPSLITEDGVRFKLLDSGYAASLLPKIIPIRHKYESGYVVGISGSLDLPGAAHLAGLSSLRGGAGIVRLWQPQAMECKQLGLAPEVICSYYKMELLHPLLDSLHKASALFIGPGIGRSNEAIRLLHAIFPEVKKPCVIDADALTLIAENSFLSIPPQALLTPHKGEMDRLLKKEGGRRLIDEAYLSDCQAFCEKHNVSVLLKGAPTFVFSPQEPVVICSRGDPGMATAGSGDVLTGLLAALLAQGLSVRSSALLGAFLHGLAGEYAAEKKTSYCLIASDIIKAFPHAFKKLLLARS